MKYVVVCPDGLGDRPVPELGGKTPLEAASTPNLDELARKGSCGLLTTFYRELPQDSGVANLSLLGYDPRTAYPGRGPLEALNMDLELRPDDVALRCNTITVGGGRILDYSAGHIPSDESRKIIEFANSALGSSEASLHAGPSYRHILLLRGGFSDKLACAPPHNVIGESIAGNLIKPADPSADKTAELLNKLMLESEVILADHEVNRRRAAAGKNPANMLWFWGPGKRPKLESFMQKFGVSGSVISAVNILKGIARALSLGVADVPGATGYLDTNYEGKAAAALKVLETQDFVYVHVESTDEGGHEGSVEHKIKAIEDIDARVVGRMLDGLDGDFVFAVSPDHATPVTARKHTEDPVPFLIYDTRKSGDGVDSYGENAAEYGTLGRIEGTQFMKLVIT